MSNWAENTLFSQILTSQITVIIIHEHAKNVTINVRIEAWVQVGCVNAKNECASVDSL